MPNKIDMQEILRQVSQSPVVRAELFKLAEEKLEKETEKFLEEFESHDVSREIEEGPEASNISNTLGGYGNLFSFIGFNSGSTPVQDFIQYFKKNVKVGNKITTEIRGNNIVARIEVRVPSKDEVGEQTPLPWDTGSWLLKIERGISGLGFYINRLFSGRSGGGVQTKSKVRSGQFRPVKYFSFLYNKFLKNLSFRNSQL